MPPLSIGKITEGRMHIAQIRLQRRDISKGGRGKIDIITDTLE